jgi:hypothetical protein
MELADCQNPETVLRLKSDDFRDGCLLATNLGDDADTTAAVYGQLAGAFYGEAGIPIGRAVEQFRIPTALWGLQSSRGRDSGWISGSTCPEVDIRKPRISELAAQISKQD